LITSRRTDWSGIAKAMPLELMLEAEALQLLTGRSDAEALPAPDLAEAKALARELGYLPLALAQAQAFMWSRKVDVAGYRQQLISYRPQVMAWRPQTADYPLAIAEAWQASVDHAERDCPAARELLQLLVFISYDAIPRDLFGAAPQALPECLRDTFDRDTAIETLARFSLLSAEAGTLTVHRLVRAVTLDVLDEATTKSFSEIASRLVDAYFPLFKPEDQALLDEMSDPVRRATFTLQKIMKREKLLDTILTNISHMLYETANSIAQNRR
jgi:hypothetical protein